MKPNSEKTKTMVKTALMAAVITVCSLIYIPIGPVPFSMAIMGVILAGCLLRPLPALASVGVYVALGLVGLPIFSGNRGGPQVLLGPTGGYIVGYFAVVFLVAFFRERLGGFPFTLLGGVLGIIACYTLGTAWFMVVTNSGLWESLTLCVIPFILPDLGKLALAVGIGLPVAGRLAKMNKA